MNIRTDKTLITGITGMVGSHMADYLLDKTKVIGLKRWRSPMDNVKQLEGKVKFFNGDLKDLSSMITLIKQEKPDIIYHFAAQSLVPVSFTMPHETFYDNILGTLNLLEAIRFTPTDASEPFYNPTIIVVSSSEVYGQVTEAELPIKETQPFRPQSPYAVSKASCDLLARQYFDSYKMKTIRTRLFTHTGERRYETFCESSFARQITLIEKGKQEPVIQVGNLDSVRTWLDVKDAVKAYWLVKDCVPGEVYNIGGDYTCTIKQMLEHLLTLTTYKGTINVHTNPLLLRPSDVTLQIPDTSKFRNETGWKPEIKFETTMESLLSFWRERV
jgi:GDP-mannose 4,6-dehydratase